MARKLYRWISVAALVLYASAGLAWSIANLSDVPHYGDTLEYLRAARDASVGAHRGILYPWLLATAESLCVAGALPPHFAWANERAGDACTASSGLVCLQLFQIFVAAICIAYFVFVVVGQRLVASTGSRALGLWLVAGVLLLDPLINHFDFSLMSDALAFSASLAFCAAVADLALRRTPPWLASGVLLVSYLVAAGLRVEKRWTLLITLVASLALWGLQKRGGLRLPAGRLRSLSFGLALVSLGLVLTITMHRSSISPSFRMPLIESAAHLRLVFPHLTEVYEELPPRAKRLITENDARFYDEHVNNPPLLVFRVTGGDEIARRNLTKDLVGSVVPKKWPVIALDFARDSLENLFATASFYLRLAVWRVWGMPAIKQWFALDAAVWDYQRLAFHHPQLSRVYVASSLLLLALAAPVAIRRTRRRWVESERHENLERTAAWIPALVFWGVNAVSFAAYINITNVRYVIFSHAVFLVWIYANALPPPSGRRISRPEP